MEGDTLLGQAFSKNKETRKSAVGSEQINRVDRVAAIEGRWCDCMLAIVDRVLHFKGHGECEK